MELHRDAKTVISLGQSQQNRSLVLFSLFNSNGFSCHSFLIDSVNFLSRRGTERNVIQAVVACAAAELREELKALDQGVDDFLSAGQLFFANGSCKLADVLSEAFLVDVDRFVGTIRRADLDFDGRICCDLLVPLQAVDRIIGRADESHVRLLDQAADRHVGIILQHISGFVPDLLGVINRQRLCDTEIFVQLGVGPVIHRISDRHFQSFRKFHKSLEVRFVACDILFRCSVGTHNTPFIVVTEICAVRVLSAKPHLSDVVEAAVLIDLLGGDMAVIVHQRHRI